MPSVAREQVPPGFQRFLGERFALSYHFVKVNYEMPEEDSETLDRAFHVIHWILYNTDYLKDLAKEDFGEGLSGEAMAARIKYTAYRVQLSVLQGLRSKGGNPLMGFSYTNSPRITLNASRLRKGEIAAARTILHEMSHNLGFRHSKHDFIEVFGKLLQKHYDDNKSRIDRSYRQLLREAARMDAAGD